MTGACPAVHYGEPTIPFVVAVPVRCTKPAGHPPNKHGDVWHSGSGRDLDGEIFGAAWRYMPALTAAEADR